MFLGKKKKKKIVYLGISRSAQGSLLGLSSLSLGVPAAEGEPSCGKGQVFGGGLGTASTAVLPSAHVPEVSIWEGRDGEAQEGRGLLVPPSFLQVRSPACPTPARNHCHHCSVPPFSATPIAIQRHANNPDVTMAASCAGPTRPRSPHLPSLSGLRPPWGAGPKWAPQARSRVSR